MSALQLLCLKHWDSWRSRLEAWKAAISTVFRDFFHTFLRMPLSFAHEDHRYGLRAVPC